MTQQRSYSAGSYGPSLQEILLDQAGEPYSLKRFERFLRSQFCHENLAFWLEARRYESNALSLQEFIQETSPEFNLHQNSLPFLTPAQTRLFSELQSDMLVILEVFIQRESEFELNLSDMIRSKLLKAMTDGDYHPNVLGQARAAIIDLMKSSSYSLFLERVSGKGTSSSSLLSTSTCSSSALSSSSASTHTQDDNERDRRSWLKTNFKLVSKALRKKRAMPPAVLVHT